ncbi:hypothetical protein [Domibacillus robiginosus]|uniref:hypothetical protein n=1 Tax=Domibacillus robiginosus TaxID=1071054 RepID=UPI00067BF4CF|nr:hypothetical protein [Domibacillus robiginosus]
MNDKQPNTFYIIDYEWTGPNVLFVKAAGFDGEKGQEFEEIIKFLRGKPFGDGIHPEKSSLSSECRRELLAYITSRFNKKEFD